MDFDLPPEAETFRSEVRAFLTEHRAPDGSWPPDWNRRLAERGFVAPHWPRPWGVEATPVQQLVLDEELRAVRAPRPSNIIGIGWAGPTLLVAGTTEQQQRWLPGILDGSEFWCQLFSEPEAGSDLAGLRTRAERDGDEYVVNGQKIWTSGAQYAKWGILIARTDPDAAKHEGISYFAVDMATPGITIRPIRQMTGSADFNEVFFDDVRIPAEYLVGKEGDGWRLARVTLGNERVSLSGEGAIWGMGPTAHDLVGAVRDHGGVDDPVMRQRLAALYIEAEVLRLIRLRTVSARVRGLEPGPEASVRKAMADEHGQHVFQIAVDLAGAHGLLTDRGPFGGEPAMWTYGFLFSPALTVGGGTAQVQRNIIAERVLGLPRDAEVS